MTCWTWRPTRRAGARPSSTANEVGTSGAPPSSGGVTMAMIAHILEGWNLTSWGGTRRTRSTSWPKPCAGLRGENAKLGDPDRREPPSTSSSRTAGPPSSARRSRSSTYTHQGAVPPPGGRREQRSPHDELLRRGRRRQRRRAHHDAQRLVRERGHRAGPRLRPQRRDGRLRHRSGGAPTCSASARELNAIAPGKSGCSPPCPPPSCSLTRKGAPSLGPGAAGGSFAIITAVFEELLGERPGLPHGSRRRGAPRFHQQGLAGRHPARALSPETCAALRPMGHETKETERSAADAPAIGRAIGLWEAGTEPRRDGGLGLGL